MEPGIGGSGIKYSEAVEASVVPSRPAAVALLLACAATLAVMAFTPMGSFTRAGLGAGVILAFADAIRVVALRRGSRGVSGFRVDLARSIRVRDAAGREREGVLRDGSFVAPWLTLVRWRPSGARFDRTFLLVPGMLDREDFRRLRVLLRWA
jgi:toxin CptA